VHSNPPHNELLAAMHDGGVYLFRMRGVDLSALDPIDR
jgi:hypothetical protein